MKVIGNIKDLKGGGGGLFKGLGKGLGTVGQRLGVNERAKRLTSTALDRGEQQAKAAIDDALPELPPLDDLTPEQQEQFLAGLDMALDAVSGADGPGATAAVEMISGLYEACAGISDQVGVRGLMPRTPESAGVDVIGLGGPAWEVGSLDDDEWR